MGPKAEVTMSIKQPAGSGRAKNETSTNHSIATPQKSQRSVANWTDSVQWHWDRGIKTIPVHYRDKNPIGHGWQNTTDSLAVFRERVGNAHCNVGILLGGPSQVVDIDLDSESARVLAPKFLPPTDYRWGRPGNPHSHYLYRCRDKVLPPAKFSKPDGTVLLELRGDGQQSVIPPSIHKDTGEVIAYVAQGEPSDADYESLRLITAKIAAAALLLESYPGQGGRNDYVLAVAGALAHGGWDLADAQSFITVLANAAGDDEHDSRMAAIQGTFEKHARKEAVTGLPTLAERIGDEAMRLVSKWLGLQTEGQTHETALELVDSLLAQARVAPSTFVADTLKNPAILPRLVELRTREPALVDSLTTSLKSIDGIRKQDAETLRKAIRDQARISKPQATVTEKYFSNKDGTFMRAGSDGFDLRLANFSPRIAREIIYDDGVEQQRHFEIEVELKDRSITCTCPAGEFGTMNWVATGCGAAAIMEPGHKIREELRVATQTLSGEISQDFRYTCTGWVTDPVSKQTCYAHAGGAIGATGPLATVQTQLDGVMSRYRLPNPVEGDELAACYQAFQRLFDVAPARIMIPLLAGTFRAALGPTDFGLYLVGRTGTGKSELSALANQFYGPELDARHLPGSFTSTGNALEIQTFLAKDALFTIDDFAPAGTRNESQKIQQTAERIIRALGNGASRARLTSDATLRQAKPPRCSVLMSGEDVPTGHSIRARLLVLEVNRGDISQEAWAGALTECQKHAREGRYAGLMATFIQWTAQDRDGRLEALRQSEEALRHQTKHDTLHRRTNDTSVKLIAAWQVVLSFLEEHELVSAEEAAALLESAEDAIAEAVASQQEYQGDNDAADRFLDLIRTAMLQGEAHLTDLDGGRPLHPQLCGYRKSREGEMYPGGSCIGVVNGDSVHLLPGAAIAAAGNVASKQQNHFSFNAVTLGKRLQERGLLQKVDEAREKNVVRMKIGNDRKGYWVLESKTLSIPSISLAIGSPDDSEVEDAA